MKSVEIAIDSLKKDADLDIGNHDTVLKELNSKKDKLKERS